LYVISGKFSDDMTYKPSSMPEANVGINH